MHFIKGRKGKKEYYKYDDGIMWWKDTCNSVIVWPPTNI